MDFFKRNFPPVNSKSCVRFYVPLIGAASHAFFAIHALNPHFLSRNFPSCDLAISNAILFNAHFGVGIFCYYRRHMTTLSPTSRVMYSAYSAVLFNFGSILLWAVTKSVLPPDVIVRSVFGLLTSVCLLGIGKEYLAYIDHSGTAEN